MKYIIIIIAFMSVSTTYAQNINWSSINEDQAPLTYLNFGYDFGLTSQIGYGHKLDLNRPVLLTADYSFPMGKNLVDDFKVRLGGQISIYEKNNFHLSAKVYGVFRQHQTNLVSMSNFGSEISAIIGYYKPSWHIAGEFGFDKAIVTQLKHSDELQENHSSIQDAWYTGSGGHFYYGIQGSKTIGRNFDLSLRIGLTDAQFNDENAVLPYYTQFGLIYKFPKGNN